jgi:S1-C subfamily serine protease
LAGVVPGLWLLGLNGKPVESLSAFYKLLWEIPISSKSAQLTIFDGRTIYQIPVPIVDRSTNIKKPAGV